MDVSRRYFLGASGAMAAFAAAGQAGAAAGLIKTWPLGVQLWTVNAQMKEDIPGTLKKLKAVGFDVVETAGLYGGTAQTLKGQLAGAGLKTRACHMNMGALSTDIDKHIADTLTLGAGWLVASSPKTPGPIDSTKPWVQAMSEAMTKEAYQQNAEIIAQIVPKIEAAGLKFAYHNHPMEFDDFGGQSGLDIMLTGSDKARLELDLGWVAAAGHDPVAMIKKYKGRVDLLHIKDMVKDGAGYRSVELGKGIVKWKPVFQTAKAEGVKQFFVEQEDPYLRPIFESLAESIAHLRSL